MDNIEKYLQVRDDTGSLDILKIKELLIKLVEDLNFAQLISHDSERTITCKDMEGFIVESFVDSSDKLLIGFNKDRELQMQLTLINRTHHNH